MLFKKIVKKKKLQRSGESSTMIILPKTWINEMDWNQETILVVRWDPYMKRIIITEDEKASKPEPI